MELLIVSLLQHAQAVGMSPGHIVPVDSEAVLKDALANLKIAIEESGAVVTHDRLPVLAVSEIHLLQLFQNIMCNAIKCRSSISPSIRIWAEPDTGGWEIWIRDNGIGINPKYSELIFGYFQRLHAASEYAGSGLGLATCRKIVERYGGRISVHSEEGRGAAFCFSLPVYGRSGSQNATPGFVGSSDD
jgi:light-regulated signal transduction histidine kinase (bacteriophytochrome)